jgi:DNA repair protein RadA/Sms
VSIDLDLVAVGEVGLSGELRAASQLERRLSEAARLGFKRALVPKVGAKTSASTDIELIPVSTVREAIKMALAGGK